MKENIFEEAAILSLISARSASATVTGTGVDLKDYDGDAIVILDSAAASTADTLDVKIQDSADNSAWADVSGAAFTQVTDAAASYQTLKLKTDELKRYIRAVGTIAGSTVAIVFAVSAVVQKRVS